MIIYYNSRKEEDYGHEKSFAVYDTGTISI